MRLTDLKPEREKRGSGEDQREYLFFYCPRCPLEKSCLIGLPVAPEYRNGREWGMTGDSFDDLTITPSIWHHCESDPHFFIRKGEIEFC